MIHFEWCWHIAHGADECTPLLLDISSGFCHRIALHLVLLQWHLIALSYCFFIPCPTWIQTLTSIVLEIIMGHNSFTTLIHSIRLQIVCLIYRCLVISQWLRTLRKRYCWLILNFGIIWNSVKWNCRFRFLKVRTWTNQSGSWSYISGYFTSWYQWILPFNLSPWWHWIVRSFFHIRMKSRVIGGSRIYFVWSFLRKLRLSNALPLFIHRF